MHLTVIYTHFQHGDKNSTVVQKDMATIERLQNMRKAILLLLLMLTCMVGRAAKAWNQPIQTRQSDGSPLTICLHGDEYFSWRTTLDGALLVNVGMDYYIAQIGKDGSLVASAQLAHNKEQRTALEQGIIDRQDRQRFFDTLAKRKRNKAIRREPVQMNSYTFPHEGEPKAIVVLAEFSDLGFTVKDPKATFEDYLNGEERPVNRGTYEHKNYGSVRSYFKTMSFGKFSPQFDIIGPVRLPETMEYYGKGANRKDGRVGEQVDDLIKHVMEQVKDSIADFGAYDTDGNKIIDLVYVVYAGYGESYGAPENTLWPKSFNSLYNLGNGYTTGRCGISNELLLYPGAIFNKETNDTAPRICGIGLFCHEFSHCLGLPDFYPTVTPRWTNLDDYDNQGMEDWSLMDNGEYVALGYCPTAYTAWEREAMGWMSIEPLAGKQQVKLENIDNGGKAYKIMNDAQPNGSEYYVVQNIQKTGWNSGQSGHGMLMYHVNYDPIKFSLARNAPNNEKDKPRMTVIAADGLLNSSFKKGVKTSQGITTKIYKEQLAGDPFPGTSNKTEINDGMAYVNYAPWTGGTLGKPIYNINEVEGVVYFDFMEKIATTGVKTIRTTRQDETHRRIYSLDGRYMGDSERLLPKGIYIRNRQKFVVK